MSAAPARPTPSLAVASVVAAAALWGVSGVVARALFVRDVDPGHLVQVRMLVGGLVLLAVVLARGLARVPWRLAGWLLAYAPALLAVQLTYFKAIQAAGVATAIFLQYTSPLLVAGWEAARSRRLPPRPVLVALAAAIAGSAALVLPAGRTAVPPAGFAWGVGSALAMAAGTVIAGAAQRHGVRAAPLLAYGLLLGSLAFLPVRTPWAALADIPASDWPFFLYIAVFATAVPFLLYVVALGGLRGSVAMILAMLEPVLAALLAWIALGEALSAIQLAGGALILGGIALAAAGR